MLTPYQGLQALAAEAQAGASESLLMKFCQGFFVELSTLF